MLQFVHWDNFSLPLQLIPSKFSGGWSQWTPDHTSIVDSTLIHISRKGERDERVEKIGWRGEGGENRVETRG